MLRCREMTQRKEGEKFQTPNSVLGHFTQFSQVSEDLRCGGGGGTVSRHATIRRTGGGGGGGGAVRVAGEGRLFCGRGGS